MQLKLKNKNNRIAEANLRYVEHVEHLFRRAKIALRLVFSEDNTFLLSYAVV